MTGQDPTGLHDIEPVARSASVSEVVSTGGAARCEGIGHSKYVLFPLHSGSTSVGDSRYIVTMGAGMKTSAGRQSTGWLALGAAIWVVMSGAAGVAHERASREPALQPVLRSPVALAFDEDQQYLYVANRRTGSISVMDAASNRVVAEVPVGVRLSDLAWVSANRFVATDEAAHQLLLLTADGANIAVLASVSVPRYPVSVAVSADGRSCTVAALWSRRLAFVDLEADGLQVEKVLDMPFAPRTQLRLADRAKLIVADSFGGRLGVIDLQRRELLHVREFPAHNIRGLGRSRDGRMLVVAHQMLNELAHSVRNDVHWGLLMSNDLRWLRVDAVLAPDGDLYEGAHMHPLGGAGSATGDPAGLIVVPDGRVVVSLGGVGEFALGREEDFSLARFPVDRRPTALLATRDGRRLFVANTLGDTISAVDLNEPSSATEISLGPRPPLTLADRGEQVFFDATLSHDAWMSCHSCHTDGHTNGLTNDNLSDATFGAPKRVLSLLGKAATAPFAWDASAADLPTQIRNSIHKTMQSDRDPRDDDVAAIEAYLATLAPPPSIAAAREIPDDDGAARGAQLFAAIGCTDCHTPPVYTSPDTYDVGLVDELGRTRFNPPSLLGVSQRGPYFHDNRAATLEDVFRTHGHQLDEPLEPAQLNDLLIFLRSL